MAPSASLAELRAAHPREWEEVERELAGLVARQDRAALARYVEDVAAPLPAGTDPRERVRRQMAVAAVRGEWVRAAAGVRGGRIRFGLVNGFVAQRLLFARGLERKPVSMRWFRAVWPLLWQRRRLLPLVQPKGIYCFYSRRSDRRARAADRRPPVSRDRRRRRHAVALSPRRAASGSRPRTTTAGSTP